MEDNTQVATHWSNGKRYICGVDLAESRTSRGVTIEFAVLDQQTNTICYKKYWTGKDKWDHLHKFLAEVKEIQQLYADVEFKNETDPILDFGDEFKVTFEDVPLEQKAIPQGQIKIDVW